MMTNCGTCGAWYSSGFDMCPDCPPSEGTPDTKGAELMKCGGCGRGWRDSELIFNYMTLTLQCPVCGDVVTDTKREEEEAVISLGERNRQVYESVEVHEEPHPGEQYFVMWGKECEEFQPSQIVGVWGAQEAADIVRWYRETGIVKVRKPGAPRWGTGDYEYHRSADWCYVMKAEAMFAKLKGFYAVDRVNVR